MTDWYQRSINALQLNGKGERTQEACTRAVRMLSTPLPQTARRDHRAGARGVLPAPAQRRPLVAEHDAHLLLRHSVLLRARPAAELAPLRHPAREERGAPAGDPERRGSAGDPAVRADAP